MKQLNCEIKRGKLGDKINKIVTLTDVYIKRYPKPKRPDIGDLWVFGVFGRREYTWAPSSGDLRDMNRLYRQRYDFYIEFKNEFEKGPFYWKPNRKNIDRLLLHERKAKKMNKEVKNKKSDSQLYFYHFNK